MTNSSTRLSLTLNPGAVVAPVMSAIKESTEIIGICLDAIAKTDLSQPIPSTSFYSFYVDEIDPSPSTKGQQDRYANWLLSKGFQDLAKGIRLTLEEAYLYTEAATLQDQKATLIALQSQIERWRKNARKLNFPDLLQAVNTKLFAQLHFDREFQSLQKVRNCLEHRNGIVSSEDINTDRNTLKLVLPRLRFSLERDGTEIDVSQPIAVKAGEKIGVERIVKEREYALSEKIGFSADEFAHIATACALFAMDLAKKLPNPMARGSAQPLSD
jgi:hypothetical protein